jgi:hypothetical protein
MVSYKDTTYCITSTNKCSNTDCNRFISAEQIAEAKELDLPICWGDFYNPSFGLNCNIFKGKDNGQAM